MGRQLRRYYLQSCLIMCLERIAFLQQDFHCSHVLANDGGAELVRRCSIRR